MTTWELISHLVSNTTFYWRKFFVFLLVVVTLGGGYFAWHSQNKVDASSALIASNTALNYDGQVIDIVVTDDGQVLSEQKNISSSLKILANSYEISALILDNPISYLSEIQVLIHLPEPVTQKDVAQRAYAVHGVGSHGEYLLDSTTLAYVAKDINPGSTYTIVAELPKNILTPPPYKQFFYKLSQYSVKSYLIAGFLIPIITFIILILMIVRRRQDQFFYLSSKVVNQIPNNLPPAVVGALMDGKVGAREIAATLIDLANRGYLFINRHENGTFSFGKRKTLNLETLPELNEFERILLSKIFEPDQYKSTGEDVQMRIGRHIFSRKIAQVYLNIYNEAIKLGYFVKNPVTVHLQWRFAGIGLFFLGLAGFFQAAIFVSDSKYILLLWVGAMIASTVIIWLSGLMPVRSVTGTAALRQWMQFKKFLSMPRPVDGGAIMLDQFNNMLAYAIVFGVEADWTRRFVNANFTKPSWYESDEMVVTLDAFVGGLFPIINWVGGSLDRSHEPTVE